MKHLLSVVVCMGMLVAGCFQHIYTVGKGAPRVGEPKYDKWHSHFLSGLIGKENLNIKEICPSGNATIVDEISFTNRLVAWLCLGGLIYYPSTVKVYCADSNTTSSVDISQEEARRIVMSPEFVEHVREVDPARVNEVEAAQKYGPLAN